MDGGCEYERQHHRTEEPAYDDNRQRLKHLRARADRKGQRKHAGDGGQRGHGDGPQTAASGLNHGVFRGKTEIAEAMLRVEKQDAVLAAIPITMIMPMQEATLKLVPVINKRKK